ncbi:protein-disulfide reductase DsbD family protein [Albibacterium bauzanense]|uniref:Thiol:disulfide interchange protein DsbD n=1 Tax=Albibacterium bauzanense TaxID=653929 RepID=A0A4R1LV48_9SPHI|nr:thioredoxin family protein [Albibacterium bauzanense]TCK82965.1 thiol:disulfide interchange protein DsbD [Albibacterium bauzanense]
MKKIFSVFILLFWGLFANAQIYTPVTWKFEAENITKSSATLVITADIAPGWHVYSQFIEDGGPIPTSFSFEKGTGYTLDGTVTESPKAVGGFDPTFKMQISWHKKQVKFSQKIKLTQAKVTVKGVLEFMTCDDSHCLPPEEVPFSISVDASNAASLASSELVKPSGSSAAGSLSSINESTNIVSLPAGMQQDSGTAELDSSLSGADSSSASDSSIVKPGAISSVNNQDDASQNQSLWGIFIAGLIGGFAAFLMPCIYPMVPLTTSYFTKRSGSRTKGIWNAIIYGISIVVIYVALGMIVTLIFGASALNEAASSAVFNLLFFAIILVFAISFLGAFEITLPSRFVNKMDEKSDKGGLLGIFFMAFTLALVSFSCTGPIIGYLLVEAVSKGTLLGPAIGMLGFSIALAIPFIIFALFPAFLKEMPKSGGWLNTVKVSLGFLELALAFKFLSNVDLAYHWGLLDREVFLALWIVIFGLFGFYLLGKIKLSASDDIKILSLPRLFFAILIFSFTIYMVPGMWGAPLKGISAWLPPQPTQDFDLNKLTYGNIGSSNVANEGASGRKYADIFHAPHGLDAFYDYQEGLDYAQKVNKPVLIDFTGWSCVNCRKMEASVWPDPEVLKRLKQDFVLISLYVDDKTELEESEKYVSEFSGKKIARIGQKWSDMQASVFGTNSQPYYVIADSKGQKLVPAQAYNLSIPNYIEFLDSGLEAYRAEGLK